MGEKTGISWTNSTWNPWQGCTKTSPGCAHCYMYREKTRWGQDPTAVVRSRDKTFYAPLHWDDGRMIFTCSWSDFFHEAADAWREDAWEIIRKSPRHTYQILTKRPERILANLPQDWGDGWPNVWLGVSVENQDYLNRIQYILSVPAAARFVSIEPILGLIDMRYFLNGCPEQISSDEYVTHDMAMDAGDMQLEGIQLSSEQWIQTCPPIDQIIVGDESGPNAREAELDWVRSIRDQCVEAGVPFFFKQFNGTEMPELDGKVWDQIPERS